MLTRPAAANAPAAMPTATAPPMPNDPVKNPAVAGAKAVAERRDERRHRF